MAVLALVHIDELNRAHALTEAMLVDAQTRGSVAGFIGATGRRGLVALRRGALAAAEADTRAAFELATEHNLTITQIQHPHPRPTHHRHDRSHLTRNALFSWVITAVTLGQSASE